MCAGAIRSPFLHKRVRFSGGAAAVQCGMLLQPKVWITLVQRKNWERAVAILLVLNLSGRDRDVRDMTMLSYGAVAWARISKRDGRLLLTRQDVFSGKG
jgi:hypothetical protein